MLLSAFGYPCFKGTTQCFSGSWECRQMVAETGAVEGCFQVGFLNTDVHESPVNYITKEVGAGLVFNCRECNCWWCVCSFAHFVAFV